MVRSTIFDECVYLETKTINTRDEEDEIQLYKIKLLNCDNVYITVGTPNKKNRKRCLKGGEDDNMPENNLIYHLIYLMDSKENDVVVARIGVYEILETKYNLFLDEDGDLMVDKLTPLLFKFVDNLFLERNNYYCKTVLDVGIIEKEVVDDAQIVLNDVSNEEESDDEIEIVDDLIPIYPKQTLENYNEEHNKSYLSKPFEGDVQALQWIRAYLMNINFRIIDKGGSGDCLFYSLASAINNYSINNKGNGVPVFSEQNVSSLRQIIADNVTDDDYNNYITIYRDLTKQKSIVTRDIKEQLEHHKRIMDNFKQTTNESRRGELVVENKEIKKMVKKLEDDLKGIKQMLKEFRYMKSLRTLRDFKSFLLTNQYWGDEMAIGKLQKHFNFKAIVLSQEMFINTIRNKPLPLKENDIKNMKNIIQCGSSSLGGLDNPYFYIILNYTGNHYQLITYRGKEGFTFEEIPFTLTLSIVRGCMKNDLKSGYGKIEKFVEFRDENIELMF